MKDEGSIFQGYLQPRGFLNKGRNSLSYFSYFLTCRELQLWKKKWNRIDQIFQPEVGHVTTFQSVTFPIIQIELFCNAYFYFQSLRYINNINNTKYILYIVDGGQAEHGREYQRHSDGSGGGRTFLQRFIPFNKSSFYH